jgi:hypothetical protein
MVENKNAAEKGKWPHSGINQHKEHCHLPVDWENPKIITTMTNKNKKKLAFDLKVCEAVEIRKNQSWPERGLNEDFGAYIRTNTWAPVLNRL